MCIIVHCSWIDVLMRPEEHVLRAVLVGQLRNHVRTAIPHCNGGGMGSQGILKMSVLTVERRVNG